VTASCFTPCGIIRNRRPVRGLRSPGFTLMEMLLAITVLVIIVVIIGGAMRLGYRSADSGERKIESADRLRRSVEIMESQIQSSLPLIVSEGGEKSTYFSGGRKALTMATNYSAWDGRRGYLIAAYAVTDDQSGKESLSVSENTVGTEAKSETLLLKDCDVIEFSYLEKGLTKEDTKWIEEWKSEETEPQKIKVRIKYRGWDYSLVVPLRVHGAT
jgi:general secretion pathway protein J